MIDHNTCSDCGYPYDDLTAMYYCLNNLTPAPGAFPEGWPRNAKTEESKAQRT